MSDLPAVQAPSEISEPFAVVRSLSTFRGHPGEGRGGFVQPGDVLTVTRSRAADLRANGLVADANLPTVIPTVVIETAAEPQVRAAASSAISPKREGSDKPPSGFREFAAATAKPARTVTVVSAKPEVCAGPAKRDKA